MIRVLKTADDTIEIDAISTVGMTRRLPLSFDGLLEKGGKEQRTGAVAQDGDLKEAPRGAEKEMEQFGES